MPDKLNFAQHIISDSGIVYFWKQIMSNGVANIVKYIIIHNNVKYIMLY